MLEYIATHHVPATNRERYRRTSYWLHANHAMNVFQRTMQMTIKQYIAMRINHARALLSDTDRTILDISPSRWVSIE